MGGSGASRARFFVLGWGSVGAAVLSRNLDRMIEVPSFRFTTYNMYYVLCDWG